MRGRMTLEQHQLILDLAAGGESLEAIASRLGRSIGAIRKVAGERPPAQPEETEFQLDLDLDDVVDFLSGLPEEGLKEVCQLASLQRRSWQLKNQLLARLQQPPV